MRRLCLVAVTICLIGCSDGSSPPPSSPTTPKSSSATASTPYTRPAAHDLAVVALIDELASRYPPEPDRFHTEKDGPTFIPKSDAERDASREDHTRVWKARTDLVNLGTAAFPDLAANSRDPRYSYSAHTQEILWRSVGDACFSIIEEQVDMLKRPRYFTRERPGGGRAGQPYYLLTMRQSPGLEAWWEARKARSLRELQIEAIEWTIREEEKSGFTDDAQRHEVLDPLEIRLAEVRGAG